MARPIKTGIDYFTLETNLDKKRKLIFAKHGPLGDYIIIRLWAYIYSESYYLEWNEEVALLFAEEIKCDIQLINVIVKDAVHWKLFNQELFEKHGILTSVGIQKRYFEATSRRKQVEYASEFYLLQHNAYNNLINANRNSKNAYRSTQSKVKETRVKETRVKKEKYTQGLHLSNEFSVEDFVDDWKKKLKKQTHGEIDYPEEFETWWINYPRKADKKKAFKCWLDCLEAGAAFEILLAAASNYSEACREKGTTKNYIKHPSTFLGPDEPWRDYTRGSPDEDEEESPTICPICDIELIGARPTCPVCFLPVDDFDNPEAVEEYKERLRDEQTTSR